MPNGGRLRGMLAGMAAGCIVQASSLSLAQAPAPPSAELQRQYDAAFQETLRQPANLDVLFKFATLASRAGDLEGAISALERMLLINPDLPRVRLELGVLYFRLASYEIARTYIEAALRSPNLPAEVRLRAEQFMAEVETRTSPSHIVGELFLGWRFQSSANLGPPTSNIRLFGVTANLSQSSVGAPDWGLVTSLQARHSYDLGLQEKSALETLFTAYANRQFTLPTANVSLIDISSGPRFQVFNGIFQDVTLKPFLTGGQVWIYDTPYYGNYGVGIETGILLSDRLRNTSSFVARKHDHQDTWYLTTNSYYRGTEYTFATNFQYQLTNVVSLLGTGTGQRYETEQTMTQNYELWGAGGGFSFRFADPVFKTPLPWSLALTYTYQWWRYDVPDPTVDSTVQRRQLDSILSLVLSVPFDDRTTLTLTGGRFVRTSNLPNYEFENNNAMFGVSWRF